MKERSQTYKFTSNKGSYCDFSARKLASHYKHLFGLQTGYFWGPITCSFPIFVLEYSPRVFTLFRLTIWSFKSLLAFSVGCSLSFCRNILSSVAPLFRPAVVSNGQYCLVQLYQRDLGLIFYTGGPVRSQYLSKAPHFGPWPALAASTFCLSQCLLWHTGAAYIIDGRTTAVYYSSRPRGTCALASRCFRLLL